MQTDDREEHPPGFYYFELEAILGSQTFIVTHVIHLIDPCSEMELSLVEPLIFVDKNYFLRDDELRYDWTDKNLI